MNFRIVGVVVITICSASSCAAADKTTPADTDVVVSRINEQCETIDHRIDSTNMVVLTVFGRSSEGGGWIGFFNGDTLEKIKTEYCYELGKSDFEYYLVSGKLVFVVQLETDYDRPFYEDSMRVISTVRSRFYFRDSTLVRWLDDEGKKVDSTKETYERMQRMLLLDANECKQELARRTKGPLYLKKRPDW